ncbi:hypothetical protein SNE40_006864 [Patella caerulea]|uniref:Hexosyltransferase n=1 Tax=Patella caerulea TaxID=87958 RepID=A0AAN8JVC5_PATCE
MGIGIVINFRYLVWDFIECGFNPYLSGKCFSGSRTHNFKYLINKPNLCNGSVFLLIAVVSAPSEFDKRRAIRETWGSIVMNDAEVRLCFILGYRSNVDQNKTQEESDRYGDIVQEDFLDSYKNLSIKSEAILRFAFSFCPEAKYILKTDTDMFINVPVLVETLRKNTQTNMIMGFVHSGATPYSNRKSKWFIERGYFPLTYYPDYASGTAYVLTQDVTKNLFIAALHTKYFSLEDVFITGILRTRIKANLIHHEAFHSTKLPVDICSFKDNISAHRFSAAEIRKIWSQKHLNKSCESLSGGFG